MCETCREMHNSVPAFENHLLEAIEIVETDTMVCSRHGQNMAYICCHCVKGICVDCMFLDEHSDHKSDIEEFSIGIYTLREMISQVQIHVKEDIKELESGKKKAEEDLQMLDSIMNNIKDRLVVVQSKCEKECEFLLSLAHSAFKEPTKMAVAIFKSLALEAQNASVLIQELLLKGDEEFLKKFRNVQANVNSIRLAADHANKSNYPIAEFTPTGENMEKMLGSLKRKENGGSEGEYVSQMEKDGYMYIQQSKLRIELTQVEEKDLKRPVQFAFIDNNSVVFADLDYKFVTRIDRMGHLVAKYYQQSAEGVNSLCVYGNSMFMAVPDGITMFPLSYSPGLGCCFYKPDVTNVGKIAVKDPCTIVITDREVGQVVEFNSHTNKTKVVADQVRKNNLSLSLSLSLFSCSNQCLDRLWLVLLTKPFLFHKVQCPTYITVSCRNGGCQYLVTERDQHRVRVYDQDWNFVATLGGQGKNEGQLQLPRGTTVTPGGKVLVADWGNNRISQFQMDGTFER